MKKKSPEEKALEFLQGDIASGDETKVISYLRKAGINEDELKSIEEVDRLLEEAPVGEPSQGMDKRFYEMLERDKNRELIVGRSHPVKGGKRGSFFLVLLGIAAGIALFILGWFAAGWWGHRSLPDNELAVISGELKDLKETLVISMLHQNSTIDRIKAVNMVNELDTPDTKIIENLLGVLNNDSNDNVRLLALEALIRYSDNPAVREGLVASIPNQYSPMIQVRLTEIMIALEEKRAVSEFQKLLTDARLNYSVRNKILEAVTVLM